MRLRVRKHASESAKALIQGYESIGSGVRKDASEGVGALLLLLWGVVSLMTKEPRAMPWAVSCSFSALLRKRLLRRRAGLAGR